MPPPLSPTHRALTALLVFFMHVSLFAQCDVPATPDDSPAWPAFPREPGEVSPLRVQ